MIRAVVIDDENAAVELLCTLLGDFVPDVEVVGRAYSASEGAQVIREVEPDLIFLDINMPKGGGFDLLRSFQEIDFEIIFTTAYDKYAIKAIQFSALDYLLKPVSISDLQEAVQRYHQKQERNKAKERSIYFLPKSILQLHQQNTKMVVPILKGLRVLTISEINYIKAAGVYADITLQDGSTVVISKGLKYLDEELNSYGIIRIHDSYMINLNHVDRYLRGRGGTVIMKDGTEIEVSRSRKENLLKLLKRR